MTPAAQAQATIQAAIAEFGRNLVIVTSFQREGVIILDLVLGAAPRTPVITLDTGRLPAATHKMIDRIERRYSIAVERVRPDPAEVTAMVETHGRDLFRDSVAQRMLCCNVRKVRPLERRMASVAAYFAGIRRAQGEARADVEIFDRTSSPVKISPLAAWAAEDVAQYTRERELPEHPLYAAGYTSIGCDPCTRAVTAGEDERAGRWWWESDTAKECGLHFSADGKAERTVDVLLRDVLVRAQSA
jgi:phosphoadenylyl-sulfate reductase (thioredoxin)